MSITGISERNFMLLRIEHVPIKTKICYLYELSRRDRSIDKGFNKIFYTLGLPLDYKA